MDPGLGLGAGDQDLEEREEAVEGVLADVGPAAVGSREPGAAVGVEDPPVHDGDEERVARHGAVEERV